MDKLVLATLCLLTAPFAGCLGAHASIDPALHAGNTTPSPSHPSSDASTQNQTAAPAQECKGNNNANNYGTWIQVGDSLYVVAPYQGEQVVVYRESNGKQGLQTVADCPNGHDTLVAEAPQSMPAAGSTPHDGCNGDHSNSGVEASLGPDSFVAEPGGIAWYHESNGLAGIQTRSDCAVGHDALIGYLATTDLLPTTGGAAGQGNA